MSSSGADLRMSAGPGHGRAPPFTWASAGLALERLRRPRTSATSNDSAFSTMPFHNSDVYAASIGSDVTRSAPSHFAWNASTNVVFSGLSMVW